jgi:hypothetical protein
MRKRITMIKKAMENNKTLNILELDKRKLTSCKTLPQGHEGDRGSR